MKKRWWNPALWAGLIPNGMGQVKPHHYWEMVRAAWENRDQAGFAWRILSRGVCDGCALGTTGMRDFTMKGVHLCTVRLNLLRLNTMPPLQAEVLQDVSVLERMSSRELRRLGRLPYPMLRRRGDRGFHRISWEAAFDLLAARLRGTDPRRIAFYLTSRGITNEVYYVAQKVARFLGTNNIDHSARICHSPSTTAMKQAMGVGASTCSYSDWIGTDLLILIGSDVPNNQPVTTKYMYLAKQAGTRVLVVNPFREPGLERYWVPSVLESAVFGTRIADEFFPIHIGGDMAFLNGVLKALIEIGGVDEAFVAGHTVGFEQVRARLSSQSWESLERCSGSSETRMRRLAGDYARARSAVFVWSMGVTQHRYGVDNVRAILNLALARGMLGRPNCGVMPIRGHSGVQGGGEVGCVPSMFPGGAPVNDENAADFTAMWGFTVPAWPGLSAAEMVESAHAGLLDLLYIVGGNFLETLPQPDYVREALARTPLRVHQDIVLSPQMFVEPGEEVLLLPAQTRYEQSGGGTETTTERRILLSPEIPGRRIGESRPEWWILMMAAERARPELRSRIHFVDAQDIREEMAKAVPFYKGIEKLRVEGDALQWGGPQLCQGGRFPTDNQRARFTAVDPPTHGLLPGTYLLSTRRGKQFNSMVQADRDPLTGARRDDVFISPEDARELGIADGEPILLRSKAGQFSGRCKIAAMNPGNLQIHWPEGNILIEHGIRDREAGIPDYNAVVEIVRLDPRDSGG